MESVIMIDVLIALLPPALTITWIGLALWALVDMRRHQVESKPLWMIIIVFIPLLGAVAYFVHKRGR
jgi:hypothetical protein